MKSNLKVQELKCTKTFKQKHDQERQITKLNADLQEAQTLYESIKTERYEFERQLNDYKMKLSQEHKKYDALKKKFEEVRNENQQIIKKTIVEVPCTNAGMAQIFHFIYYLKVLNA